MKVNKRSPSDSNTFQSDISHDDITELPVQNITENPCVLIITGVKCKYLYRFV